jgi:hypothetical protein
MTTELIMKEAIENMKIGAEIRGKILDLIHLLKKMN